MVLGNCPRRCRGGLEGHSLFALAEHSASLSDGSPLVDFSIRRLTCDFGLEILTGDVRALGDHEFGDIAALWRSERLLLFRGQRLDLDEQKVFAERFGALREGPETTPEAGGNPHVMIISNRMVDGKPGSLPDGEMWFHYDQAYLEAPALGGILYAIALPVTGGNTLFADATAAYRRLSGDLKSRLNGLLAENAYNYTATTAVVSPGSELATFTHPVVIEDSLTAAPSLFVSRLMTRRLVGTSDPEGKCLLGRLLAEIERPDKVYEHHWSLGDLLIWNNRSILHARSDFDSSETRILRRLSLKADGSPMAYYHTNPKDPVLNRNV